MPNIAVREPDSAPDSRILQAVFDNMSEGVSMVDENLVVIAFNRRMLELLEFPTDILRVGDTFEKFIRYNAERGEYGPGEIEELVSRRLDLARRFEPHYFERERPDGRIIGVRGNPLPGGGFITTYTDVTSERRASMSLAEDHERLYNAISSLSEGFALYDPDDRLVIFNEAYRRMHPGIEDMLKPGMSFSDLLAAKVERGVVTQADDQKETHFQRRLQQHRDPQGPFERELSNVCSIVVSEGRTPDGSTYITLTDVTARRQREASLAEVESQLAGIVNIAPEAIICLDEGQRIRLFNRGAEAIFGYAPGEAIGQPLDILLPERFRHFHRGAIEGFAKGDDVSRLMNQRGQVVGLRKDGTEFPAEASISQLQLSDKTIFTAILHDVTERKRAETALAESEELYGSILRNSPTAIHLKGLDGRYLYVNERFREWFRLADHQVIGRTSHEVFPSAFADIYVSQDAVVTSTHETIIWEIDFPYNDGTLRRAISTKFPVFDPQGKIRGIGTISTDITDRRQMELELRKSQEQLIEAQRIAQIGSWELELAKGTLIWTEEVYRIFECEPEKFSPSLERFFEFVHSDDREKVRDAYFSSLANRTSYQIRHRISLRSGRTKWVQERCETEYDSAGNPINSRGTVQDITEHVLAEQRLTEAFSIAEKSSKAKSEFLATMSHELRTPLNAIIGFSDIIRSEYFGPIGNEKYREYATDIEDSGRYLLDLIDDILDISKIEAGKYVLKKAPLQLPDVIDECIRIARPRATAKRISLKKNVTVGHRLLFADRRAVKQMLLNILANALQFTPPGGTVAVSAEHDRNACIIGVSDTGPGIKEAEIPFLLEPFATTRSNAHVTGEGTGLGLAITNSLVKLHGGDLSISSEPGRGTTIRIEIPDWNS